MRGIIGVILAAAFMLPSGLTARAYAVGLCDCCAGELNRSCATACAGSSKAAGQCTAVVDYTGKGTTAAGRNPLTGISLKDIALGDPRPAELEAFRRFLEQSRRRGIADYNRALSRLRKGRISQDQFNEAKALYREAMVNYYHGIRAYLVRVGAKTD